jgi:hypothetical protein
VGGLVKYLILLGLLCSGCGVNVNGHVDTSGTLLVKIDTDQLVAFFKYDCQLNLNNNKPTLDECVSALTSEFSDFLANEVKKP